MTTDTKAIIIVPSQGNGAGMFATIAEYLKRNAYQGHAAILKTSVTAIGSVFNREDQLVYCNKTTLMNGRSVMVSCPVTFRAADASEFDWASVSALESVVTISHGGSDGPNLASHMGGHQPWSRMEGNPRALSRAGNTFWSSIGRILADDGKIILLGCYMGGTELSYGQLVARAARKPTYGATGGFAAANRNTSLTHVQSIERGSVRSPMQRFSS